MIARLAERFWGKVDCSDTAAEACWSRRGVPGTDGYGQVVLDRKPMKAHRLAWELEHGPIPERMFVCHRCDNRFCVRPAHLFLGTCADNQADMAAKGRSLRGERHNMTILSDDDVLDIRAVRAFGGSQKAIAKAYGVARSTIGLICQRKTWRHLP